MLVPTIRKLERRGGAAAGETHLAVWLGHTGTTRSCYRLLYKRCTSEKVVIHQIGECRSQMANLWTFICALLFQLISVAAPPRAAPEIEPVRERTIQSNTLEMSI